MKTSVESGRDCMNLAVVYTAMDLLVFLYQPRDH